MEKVSRHSCIRGSENQREVCEAERDSPKLNLWCALMKNNLIGPFLFAEKVVARTNYLNNYLQQLPHGAIFEQDVAPLNFAIKV